MLSPKPPLAIDTRRVTSFDGTEITYRILKPRAADARSHDARSHDARSHDARSHDARSHEEAPVVVLANGLGGPYLAWRAQMAALATRYQVLTWDYRGLYDSGRPPRGGEEAYAVDRHVRDLQAILEAERISKAALAGWSMGVQVVLEAYRMLPGLARSLILICGTYGRPLDTLSPLPGAKSVLPPLMGVAKRAHAIATQMTRRATSQPEASAWLKRVGLIGPTLDDEVFAELVHAFGALDMEAYFTNLRAIGRHDAEDVLETIDVPALLIAGDKDAFMPPALAHRMARRIRSAELLLVQGGTHYTPVEFPELVSLRIERFFRRHGF